MHRLTLCMIVKDEERFLGACLDSVRGVADAIVVVDTGSTDRTPEIARKHGAKLVRHAWSDDFAAARNAALAHVSGGFVLVLDADERLGPGAADSLRAALARDDFDCGMLPLHDASRLDASPQDVVAGRARRADAVLLPRLLRRTADLRWEGVVHEQVTSWARGKRIATIAAPIVHFGAVPELRAARGKNERNLRLLEKRAELEPGNPTVLAYLARELERTGTSERALDVARSAWRSIRPSGDARPNCDVVLPATLLAFLALRAGELEEALTVLGQARRWSDSHPNLELLEGLAHERRALRAASLDDFAADLLAAQACYAALGTMRGRSFWAEVMPGALGATGATRRGTVELLLSDPQRAETAFDEALSLDPTSLEAQLGRIEAWLDAGRAEDALRELPNLLRPDCADAWLLAAAAAADLGGVDDARMFARRSREALETKPWVWDFRRGRLEELERALANPPATRARPTVSVVIPAYNRLDLLAQVLEGFARQRDVGAFELIVVDDGSQPSVRELFDELRAPSSWRLLTHERNRGRGAALNTGLEAATGDVVIFCDSDIEPSERFVAEHLEFHERAGDELATCLGALEYGVDAGLFGAWMGARSNPRLDGDSLRVDWTQWFTDNWSFRRSLLVARGLRFDERYRVWGWEELDLAHSLQALGATNTMIRGARGRHLKAATLEGMRNSFARSTPNLDLLASKWPRERVVADWVATRHCTGAILTLAAESLAALWERILELDARCGASARDVENAQVKACAIAISDLNFQVGVARGYHAGRALPTDPLHASESDRVLCDSLATAMAALGKLEESLGMAEPNPSWCTGIAERAAAATSAA